MENLITIEMIEKNQDILLGRIFTKLQLNILKKKLNNKSLDTNEKTYYYKYIKPKVAAMLSFSGISEINIHGREHMLEERLPKAVKLLQQLSRKHKNKKIMASGSFLFSKKYNDIDFFVFTRYSKEDYRKGSLHVNFLPKSALDSIFFSSISQISISNFRYEAKTSFALTMQDVLQSYELLIDAVLRKQEFSKELRDFLMKAEFASKGVILSTKQLYELKKKITYKNAVKLLSDTLVNTLLYGYALKDIKSSLKEHIRDYTSLLKKYHNAKNLEVYITTYREAIQVAA
ncbi:hypothetical protein J4206_06365 [Candidatus Woesearchaeota archaeon]|nr:hypothetical protein [Candidatus Woesearchaeota archaeon]